jgi:hypothetical protein
MGSAGRHRPVDQGPAAAKRPASKRKMAASGQAVGNQTRMRVAPSTDVTSDPKHPDHGDRIEWYGGVFDPVALDTDRIRKNLNRIAARRNRIAVKHVIGFHRAVSQYLARLRSGLCCGL